MKFFTEKFSLLFILLLYCTTAALAQLELLAVTDSVFKHPESAVYDEKRACIYISNMNKETAEDSLFTDFISKVGLDGSVQELHWLQGISSPTGLAIYQDRLFIVERNGVAVADIEKKKIVARTPIYKNGFLNDIAIDPATGNIFVSETEKEGRIFIIKNDTANVWIKDTSLAFTNGLLFHENKLLAGVNGDHTLKAINTKSLSVKSVAHLGPGNIDGIQRAGDDLLVSHFLGNLYLITSDGDVIELLNTRDKNIFIADFAYIPSHHLIVVPSLRTNRIYFYRYEK